MSTLLYPRALDPQKLEPHYSRHVAAMTGRQLDGKAEIAVQLAWRDKRIAELEALLNSAPVDAFLESVRVEAAHQVERWKIEHDDGKAPTDWLWLLGYLATKATTAATLGDTKKALHHVVTSAAVLLNWHARLSGHDRGFRPGTTEPSGG